MILKRNEANILYHLLVLDSLERKDKTMKKKLPITKAALLDLVKKGLFDRKKK
ncbi:MAG TPA: hypothetical protein PLY34_21100 [Ferruginibacter sp.]|nr:hypothetical protein [Ferruginibacter sp.]